MGDSACPSFVRTTIRGFTQFTFGAGVADAHQPFVRLKRDLFHFKFSPPEGEVLSVSWKEFGVANMSDHPTAVHVYLLPRWWERRVIKSLRPSVGVEGVSAAVTLNFLQSFQKGVGFKAIPSARLKSGYRAPIPKLSHTGSTTVALLATIDNGRVRLLDTYVIRRGDFLVLLPSCVDGPANASRPFVEDVTNLQGVVLEMYFEGQVDGARTPASDLEVSGQGGINLGGSASGGSDADGSDSDDSDPDEEEKLENDV